MIAISRSREQAKAEPRISCQKEAPFRSADEGPDSAKSLPESPNTEVGPLSASRR
jgi:hypothetical protein